MPPEETMIGLEKIRTEHRERMAFVYARQSTAAQIVHHRTSTERQLGLAELAIKLGWTRSNVSVVDDLGRSGKWTEGREGFQRLAAEMSMGRVGAVLSLDASRLARSSADWHRLLEIAALTRTLLLDEETVYDPRDPNDRLVLGMKGTMADFELVWLRQRMEGGRWHLARRGEYRFPPPAGYVYEDDEAVRLTLDPDEEVQRAISLLFERFRGAGSVQDIVKYFNANHLLFPARRHALLQWTKLSRNRVRNILLNPAYAGVYAFGRTRDEIRLDGSVRRHHVRKISRAEWPVMIRDAHPAYIPWEEFLANEKRMSDNSARRASTASRGAVREGRALLQGLLLCGRCGARAAVYYHGNNGRSAGYQCRRLEADGLKDLCLMVQIGNIDVPIVDLVFGMLTHERLLDTTRVLEIVDEQQAALGRQWQLRLERAQYDAKRAERQYDLCEPDNRNVARSLEKRWNERLAELDQLQREYEEFKLAQRFELSELDRQRILALASDLPKLWRAKTTDNRDRKLLLRLLIKDVSVRAVDVPRSALQVKVLWHTHAVTEIEIDRLGKPIKQHDVVPYRILGTTAPTPTASHAKL
jgi:DNA invertase Pin-like site-specific DNA recombinase